MSEDAPPRDPKAKSLSKGDKLAIFGLIGTVAGIVLSLYLYEKTTRDRELVYSVNPVKTIIARTGDVSDLRVIGPNNVALAGDVTAVQIAIWNRGNESIKADNILSPVALRLDPPSHIYDASVHESTRQLTNLRLEKGQLAEGIVGLGWQILEKDDGSVVQLVYAGGEDVEILLDGVIEGRVPIEDLSYSPDLVSPSDQLQERLRVRWAMIAVSTLFFVCLALLSIFSRRIALRTRESLEDDLASQPLLNKPMTKDELLAASAKFKADLQEAREKFKELKTSTDRFLEILPIVFAALAAFALIAAIVMYYQMPIDPPFGF